MANDSWLSILGGLIGDAASTAGDNLGAIYKGMEDDFNASPYEPEGARMLDRASEYYTGRSITPRQESLLSSDVGPVKANVSNGEMNKAATKLWDEHAKAMAIQNEDRQFQQAQLQNLLKKSQANDSDVFVGRGDKVISGGPQDGLGSFSKSLKPIADLGSNDVDSKKLQKAGLPEGVASLLQDIGNESPQKKDIAQEAALRMLSNAGLKLNQKPLSESEREILLLQNLIKEDSLNAPRYARRLFELMGKSPDFIDELYGKKK